MAIYNELLEGRFNRYLQKLFSMKGPASMKQLAAEVQPVWLFFTGVENRFLEEWHRYGVVGQVAGVAASNSALRFRNPSTSGMVAIIEKLTVLAGGGPVTINFDLSAATLDLSAAQVSQRLDPRAKRNLAGLIISGQATVGFATTIHQIGISVAGESKEFVLTENQEITILPGDALTVWDATLNQSLNVAAFWRERGLGDAEKS